MKNLLAICSQSPYGSHLAKEGIDAILATGIFEQNLSVLFIDDGVFQLLREQQANAIEQKTIGAALSALPLYDIEPIFVERESLSERGLTETDLIIDTVIPIARCDIAALINQQHQVLSF